MKTTWIRRLLLLLAVVLQVGILSAQENHSAATATVADIGKVVCTDGSIYATVNEAEAEGKIPAAMIAYIDTENETGLAIALSDVYDYSNQKGSFQWAEAADAVASWVDYYGYSVTLDNATWKVPTIQEWQQMLIGCGAEGEVSEYPSSTLSYLGINEKLTAAQEYSALYSSYWSADESYWSSDYAQVVGFSDYDGNIYAQFSNGAKESQWGFSIRASLTFTIDGSVSPGPVGPANITTADIGKVMCTDGSVYATVEDAENDGKTAAAMIAYIDTEGGTGLAIALSDETDNYGDNTMNREDAIAAAARHTPKIAGATWKLPTSDEWKQMLIGCGAEGDLDYYQLSYYELFAKLSEAQGYPLIVSSESNYYTGYWSSDTPDEYDGNLYARYAEFKSEGYVDFSCSTGIYNPNYVRACLAFTIGSVPVEPVNITLTTDDIGKVLCADGSVYATVSDAETDGKTPAAMIAYVDTENKTGLAIALSNEKDEYNYEMLNWEDANTAAAGHAAVAFGTWKLPSTNEWKQMLIGCGAEGTLYDYEFSSEELFDKLYAAGGEVPVLTVYWTSNEEDGYADLAEFQNDKARFSSCMDVGATAYVRACLAFTIGSSSGGGGNGDVTQDGDVTVVTLTTAGTLEETIAANVSNPMSITKLKVVGPINGTDVSYIRRMCLDEYSYEYYNFIDYWPEYDNYGNLIDPDYYDWNSEVGGGEGPVPVANAKVGISAARQKKMEALKKEAEQAHQRYLKVKQKNGEKYGDEEEPSDYQVNYLDLSDANIVAGGAAYYGYSNYDYFVNGNNYGGGELYIGRKQSASNTNYYIPFYTEDNIVGRHMFQNLYMLETLILPNSATEIGIGAVKENWNLQNVTLPANVEKIDDEAFTYLQNVTFDNLPQTLRYIGDYAFSGTPYVNVVLNNNLQHIGYNAFNGNLSTSSITIPTGMTEISDGAFSGMNALEQVTFPYGLALTRIGANAFSYCENLQSIDIPSTVTEIGEYAFSSCYSLTSVEVPGMVTTIGDGLFYACNNLTNVTLDNNLQTLPTNMFNCCSSLEEITLPASLQTIGNNCFNNCSSLAQVNFPSGVSAIGESAFAYCSSLESVTLPAALTVISDNLFSQCTSLKNISMGDNVSVIGSQPFYGTAIETIRLSGALTEIPDEMFSGCRSLVSVEMGNGVNRIGNYAFQNCNALTEFTLPESVTEIGDGAFRWCNNLTSLNLSGVTTFGTSIFMGCSSLQTVTLSPNLREIPRTLFYVCGIEEIDIPEGVEAIGDSVFYYCAALTRVTLPSTLTRIGIAAFRGCSELESVSLGSGLTTISKEAFYDCNKMSLQQLPEGLEIIDDYAFYRCYGLTAQLPNSVDSIGNYALYNCSGIENLQIPTSLRHWGQNCFYGTKIQSANIPDEIERIPYGAFANCSQLTEVHLPANLKSIGGEAFEGTAIEELDIPGTIESMDWWAFGHMSALKTATLGEGITELPAACFNQCTSLTTVNLPSTLKIIGANAFTSTTSLESLTLPNGVEEIGEYAFQASGLKSFVWPSGIKEIKEKTFYNCRNLESIQIPETLERIGTNAFYNCISLKSFTMPNTVKGIDTYAFYNNSSLENITLSNQLTSIPNSAFYNCTSLKSVVIPESVDSICENAFSYCTSLGSVSMPSTMTYLGRNAFYNCASLAVMTVPEGVTTIPYYAFGNCSSLIYLTLPSTVTTCDYNFMPSTSALTELYCYAVTPPASTSTTYKYFSGHSGTGFTVYVPDGSVDAYLDTSTAWKGYTVKVANNDYSVLPQEEWNVLKEIYDVADENIIGNRWILGDGPATTRRLAGVAVENGHITSVNLANCSLTENVLPTALALPNIQKINISNNNIEASLTDMLSTNYSTVTELNISNNKFSGNIGALAQKLPNLTTLNASNNCISEVWPVLSSKITNVNLYSQTIEMTMNFKEFAQKTRSQLGHSILCYEIDKKSFSTGSSYLHFRDKESGGNWFVELQRNPTGGLNINTASLSTGVYRGENGAEVYGYGITYQPTSSYSLVPDEKYWHRFKINFEFEMGDVDYSGFFNISDIQKEVQVALSASSTIPGYNLTAGNLMVDDEINVLDVVRTVNLLLDQDAVNSSAMPHKFMAEDGTEIEETPEAWMYVSNGKLLLQTTKEVGAMDITVSNGQLQGARWMKEAPSFSATTRVRNDRTRAIIYSMSGDKLNEGTIEIADFTNSGLSDESINVNNIMVVDPEGRPINVRFGTPETTPIGTIGTKGVSFTVTPDGIVVNGQSSIFNGQWSVYSLGGKLLATGNHANTVNGGLLLPCTLPHHGQVIVKLSVNGVNIVNKVTIK